ncbi:unnamed protein product [Anisakis simplex]|uniref:BRWD3 (inferred by orthology to a D. melanogaster protein) n=1 Tax=Anisakis simplex TaxID=6269 RepID=A0A0M3JTH5_ANISI|nr:unnamed protein product [Anisakis simplex]
MNGFIVEKKLLISELLLAIQRHLAHGPCQRAAEVLRNEIERLSVRWLIYILVPQRYDYRGVAHRQSVMDYERQVSGNQPSLVSIIERLSALQNRLLPPPLLSLPLRIFNSRRLALDRTEESVRNIARVRDAVNPRACEPLDRLDRLQLLGVRELGRRLPRRHMLHKNSMQSLELHCRILGHLSSVFCVAFDRTGRFIITGADDNLVKIWSATSGLLRFTLRGHSGEITDMTVSDDNVLLATGSVDKTVRIWCLQTAACLRIFRSHTAMVTLISFLPFVDGDTRYLISTGRDCVVNFYRYTASDHIFENHPLVFHERTSTGSRVISSCHSPGGNLVVVGDTHHFIRIYRVFKDGVDKVLQIQGHTDKVDSLVWAHSGIRFASGSHDGLAKVWKFECNEWTAVVLDAKMRDEQRPASNAKNAYKVTMLCWSLEDDYAITSGSDHTLRVWNPNTGQEIRQLVGHKDEAFVLTAHPIFREYILSAGHDGFLLVWNVFNGTLVKRYQNQVDTRGNLPLFDVAISTDGTLVGAVDSHGHLSILGVGTNQRAKTMPKEQFFHTDYISVISDLESGFTIDEELEVATHLLPPPNFVNADGMVYPTEIQRLVPGREGFDPEHPEQAMEPIWLNRCMVDRLPPSTIDIMNAQLTELRESEAQAIERELKRVQSVVRINDERLPQCTSKSAPAARKKGQGDSRAHVKKSCAAAGQEQSSRPLSIDDIDEVLSADSSEDSTFTSTGHDDEESDEDEDDVVVSDDDDDEDDFCETSDNSSDSDYCAERTRADHTRSRRRGDDNEPGPSGLQRGGNTRNSSRQRQRGNRNSEVRTRRRVVISSEEDDDDAATSSHLEDQPGPSGSSRSGQARATRTAERAANNRSSRKRRIRNEHSANSGGTTSSRGNRASSSDILTPSTPLSPIREEECELVADDGDPSTSSSVNQMLTAKQSEKDVRRGGTIRQRRVTTAMRMVEFPTWMRLVQPMKFPYIAQLDDEVVYFRQGHELYLQSVEQHNLYTVTPRMQPLAELDAEEFCVVDEVKYVRRPFRLTMVRLARIDDNGVRTGLVFSVRYHDMENVPDFIILRHLYNESVSRRYQLGDRIETILDNHWWTGTVDKKEAHDEESYPRSNWYCLTVKWDTGEDEKMSPWDVQPIQPNRRSGMATEAEQLQFSAYPFVDFEWIGAVTGVEACCNRLLTALEQLDGEPDVRPFAAPVNLEEYPEYSWNVDYPIDLQTIEQRVRNKFYRRLRSCEQDIRYIAINASMFNERGSIIVHNSRVLVETLIRYLRDTKYNDARALFNELKVAPESELIEYNRRQRLHYGTTEKGHSRAMLTNGTAQGCSGGSAMSDGVGVSLLSECGPEWVAEAMRIVGQLLDHTSASHFLGLNDELSEVYKDGCDDLQTIQQKLRSNEYASPMELKSAVERLMQTCRSTVDNKRSPIYQNSLTFLGLFNNSIAPVLAKWQRMQQRSQSLDENAADSSGRNLRHRPPKSTTNSHIYNTRSRHEHGTMQDADNPSVVTTLNHQSRSFRPPNGYYRNLNNGLFAQRSTGPSDLKTKMEPILSDETENDYDKHVDEVNPPGCARVKSCASSSDESYRVDGEGVGREHREEENMKDGQLQERQEVEDSNFYPDTTADITRDSSTASNSPCGYRRSSRSLKMNQFEHVLSTFFIVSCLFIFRTRKRPTFYVSEPDDETSRDSVASSSNCRKRKNTRRTKQQQSSAARNASLANGNRTSSNDAIEPSTSRSHNNRRNISRRKRLYPVGEEEEHLLNGAGESENDGSAEVEEPASSRDGATSRKRLRPRAATKAINYCEEKDENDSDDSEEKIVYTTSVSARGRVRRHKAYS